MTPIQSRFAASLGTLILLVIVYWALSHTQFAYAIELEEQSKGGADHNWHRIEDDTEEQAHIAARADALLIDGNNSPNRGSLSPGQVNVWHYSSSLLKAFGNKTQSLPSNVTGTKRSIEFEHLDLKKREEEESQLERRQSGLSTVYASINTCSQPKWVGSGTQQYGPPQLTWYIGQPGTQSVGPGASGSQVSRALYEGFAQYQTQSSTDIYLAVSAPTLNSSFTGTWTYDIALSVDNFYHGSNQSAPFLYLVDTDMSSALLVTDDLATNNTNSTVFQQWMNLTAPLPFTVFAIRDDDNRDMGISQSYCGMQNIATIPLVQQNTTSNKSYVTTSMVTRGLNRGPKQQFLFSGLDNSTAYDATLALVGNGVASGKGVIGGGGTVWQETGWMTKSDGNCQLLYDLDFCDQVAYTVPTNGVWNTSYLKSKYDNYAVSLYQNFSYSLAQIQCVTSNDQQYSLSRNCDDCAAAYKQWLCAVTLPRCEDFSNPASYLQPRNVGQQFVNQTMLSNDVLLTPYVPMPGAPTLPGSPYYQTWNSSFATNQSRNPTLIDVEIQPGPYKEVLPCEDICFNLVQSCPAALQFGCPYPGRGLEAGYAQRPSSRSTIQCNYFGAVWYIDDARQLVPSMGIITVIAVVNAFILNM